jgi:hypothetical protein
MRAIVQAESIGALAFLIEHDLFGLPSPAETIML